MNTDTYKLFIGFRKLGEFSTIWDAKQFAQECGLSGTFSLIGKEYRDSWYLTNEKVKQ